MRRIVSSHESPIIGLNAERDAYDGQAGQQPAYNIAQPRKKTAEDEPDYIS